MNFVKYVIECVRVETGERPELQSEVLILLLAQVGLLVDVLIITQHRQQLDLFGFAVKGILQVMVVLLTDGDLLLTWLLDLHNGIQSPLIYAYFLVPELAEGRAKPALLHG